MQQLFQRLFDQAGIRYTATYLRQQIAETPFQGTLFGIGAILSRYNVSHQSIRFTDKSELNATDCPCVAVCDDGFVLAESMAGDRVTLYSEAKGQRTMPRDEFLLHWTGIAMTIHYDRYSGEPDYLKHLRDERLAQFKSLALIACVTVMLALGLLLSPLRGMWMWWALMAVNAAGLGVAFMLLQKQLHIPNRLADKLCGLAKESHCETVTQSDGADFFGLVKLSEIGGGFFAVNLLALLFVPQALFFLALVAVCVLPFSFWSVWYQKHVARSWCVLCLCTLALMWLQAGIYLVGGVYSMVSHQWAVALGLGAAYGAAVLLLNKLMNVLEERAEGMRWHFSYNNLKTSDEVVEAYEGNAPRFATDAAECSALIFGNPDAGRRITVFSNPYCGPCAMMHEKIKNMPGDDVSVSYVMTYFSDEASIINRYIIAAYMKFGPEQAWDIMTGWYDSGKKRGADYFKEMGLDPDSDEVKAEFEKHCKWRNDYDSLRGTPTVIANGREIVEPYSVEDYIYMPL